MSPILQQEANEKTEKAGFAQAREFQELASLHDLLFNQSHLDFYPEEPFFADGRNLKRAGSGRPVPQQGTQTASA
jgi:hypothetical protein